MTKRHIDSLADDKQRMLSKIDELQNELWERAEHDGRLARELVRLRECLGNTVANSMLATVLVTLGGSVISFAPFFKEAPESLAHVGIATVSIGLAVLIVASARAEIARRFRGARLEFLRPGAARAAGP